MVDREVVVVDSFISNGDEVKNSPTVGISILDYIRNRTINRVRTTLWSEPYTLVYFHAQCICFREDSVEIVTVSTVNSEVFDSFRENEIKI